MTKFPAQIQYANESSRVQAVVDFFGPADRRECMATSFSWNAGAMRFAVTAST